ncbi:MAG TPA: hypothetical protein VKV74_02620 [Bryobacteraceae bacterium]|nr:hypothetical protein [Bryobacteraceae bacterium]
MRAFFTLLGFVVAAAAQNPVTVRGTVVDRANRTPVAGAEVRVIWLPQTPVAITTDGAGGFVFQTGPGAKSSTSVALTTDGAGAHRIVSKSSDKLLPSDLEPDF